MARKDVLALLSRVNVAKLDKGIHSNIVITGVDTEERRNNGTPSKKFLFITFAEVDPTSRKKLKDIEVSWWKLDPVGNKYFQDSMLEMCAQIVGILDCYMDKDAVDRFFDKIFDDFGFKTVEDIKEYKWKIKDCATFMNNLKDAFAAAIKDHIGVSGQLLHLKLTTDPKGAIVELPRYGAICEAMGDGETTLKFSNSELKNHSKSGNVTARLAASTNS